MVFNITAVSVDLSIKSGERPSLKQSRNDKISQAFLEKKSKDRHKLLEAKREAFRNLLEDRRKCMPLFRYIHTSFENILIKEKELLQRKHPDLASSHFFERRVYLTNIHQQNILKVVKTHLRDKDRLASIRSNLDQTLCNRFQRLQEVIQKDCSKNLIST